MVLELDMGSLSDVIKKQPSMKIIIYCIFPFSYIIFHTMFSLYKR
jgi:hypothetical protein